VGKVCNLPVRAAWVKKGQDDLCLFLDMEKINFLSEQNKTEAGAAAAPEEQKQQ
jgi:hypothetical protein